MTPAPPVAIPAGTGDDVLTGQTTPYISQARAASTNQPADNGCAFTTTTLAASNTFRPLIKMFQLQPQTAIETALNSTMNYKIGPFETVYFYGATGNVISKIINLSSFDYGCVQLEIDRAGNNAAMFNSNTPKYFLTAKSIYFTPQFDNPAGMLNITMYFTTAEKAGWEAATSNVFSAASIIKVKGRHINEVTPATPYLSSIQQSTSTSTGMLGTDYFISGNFSTGFSGIAVGLVDNAVLSLRNKVVLSGSYDGFNSMLRWNVLAENTLQSTSLQRSYNGADYTDVKSNTNVTSGVYSFIDNPENTKVYYRIKFVENSGAIYFSNIVLLSRNGKLNINVSPNPFSNNINIQLKNQLPQNISLEMLDMKGKRIYQKNYSNFTGQLINIDLQNAKIATGLYILNVLIDGDKQTFKMVKY